MSIFSWDLMTQWPALTQRSALGFAPERILSCWRRLGLAADELLLVRDTGLLLPSQCQGLPTFCFFFAPVSPSDPKASSPPHHQLNWGGFLYQAVSQLQSLAQDLSQWLRSLQQWAELLLSVLGQTQCGRTLGTFWSHQFSPQVMSPSSHVPIKMRNQKFQPLKHYHKRQGFPQI